MYVYQHFTTILKSLHMQVFSEKKINFFSTKNRKKEEKGRNFQKYP